MDENVCEQCGTRNEPGAQFCVSCQSYLPWYDTQETDLAAQGIRTTPIGPGRRRSPRRRCRSRDDRGSRGSAGCRCDQTGAGQPGARRTFAPVVAAAVRTQPDP